MSKNISDIWEAFCRHKYLWSILVFVLIAGFLDENSSLRYWQLTQHNNSLREEIAQYETEYKETTEELQRLNKSPKAYEEVARVRLFMKSEDEDVYVIE